MQLPNAKYQLINYDVLLWFRHLTVDIIQLFLLQLLFICSVCHLNCHENAEAYPSCHWAKGGVHPGQVVSPGRQIQATIHSLSQFRVTNLPNMHAKREPTHA